MAQRPLSEHEKQILQQIETAGHLRDLRHMAGWTVYRELAAAKLQAIRDRYEDARTDKDATWAAHVALQAVKEFQKGMEELVEQSSELLDPEALKQLIESATKIEESI